MIKGTHKRVLLVILDGFGISKNRNKNAVYDAQKPNIDNLFQNYPFTTIEPGGELVGLPKGVAGNSEVGHMNLGAGRPVRQDLVRINEAIELKNFGHLEKFKELINHAKKGSKRVHLLGLLSNGGVHSHINHLKEIILLLNQEKDLHVFLHAFMDGRDTSKTSGVNFIEEILNFGGQFTFASMQGRSIGMDRDRRWEKIKLGLDTIIGLGQINSETPSNYIQQEYQKQIFDEFITPTLFHKDYAIKNEDVVFFFNFRPDRARQISLALTDPHFNEFQVNTRPQYFLCMTPYIQEEMPNVPVLFDKEKIPGTLSEYLSKKGLKQFKIAETEKYAHITYFFNGGENQPFTNEERLLVNSPKDVKTYDEKPVMSAPIVLENLLKKLSDKNIHFYLVNFANPDMVGHTGNYSAAVKAVEYIDHCIGELMKKIDEENMCMIVTADHGNCDQMVYEDGSPHTSHSDAHSPFAIYAKELKNIKLNVQNEGKNALKDVAPTVLYIMGLEKPNEFSGNTIFE